MDAMFNSKSVFISGASRGLGAAFAKEVIERGADRIFVTARKSEDLGYLVAQAPDRVVPIEMELSDPASIHKAVEAAKSASIVINNAGLLHFGNVLDMPVRDIREDMEVNFYGTLEVIRQFTPHLKLSKDARVLNILSIVSLASKAGIGGYATSKAAAFSATQAIRGTLFKEGIAVHAAFPGGMDTDMLAAVTGEEKDDPTLIAKEILDQMSQGVLDIYPGHGQEVGLLWKRSPRELEQQFTGA
ncbi:SDR family NAD(P)-dependent oxidoreductase [Sneathiella sp. P13V-1]|uniref:SDR family NAD(P)-dependent oxidoreductase n=1 Tax=Sneathiella sp. P13V-1 TaxID=2697366 RepID=UPI00187BBC99|nr:SDR family NAD(P)-dependent oxidoreductase [Sneathiella sp. P13V-1]MBE7635464.1 SDR family NAD(P)-dependent oxidoreductase [Sneathiella sp. P13V-1]